MGKTAEVGKEPTVGVLIPNKTVRNKVLDEKQNIREVPIEEVKSFLMKKGLIKIGCDTPHDILRKTYESIRLMPGDVENHNMDILLHNFKEAKEDN